VPQALSLTGETHWINLAGQRCKTDCFARYKTNQTKNTWADSGKGRRPMVGSVQRETS